MSYEEFRKRIDTMCDILVGAVPSPAGQIDQITYALMYKFMNDIDEQSAAMGGKRKYFTGDYEKYNWHRLMEPGLEAHELLELYRQAIQTMSKNPNIPPLFRDIYERAFLPFNSAGVLKLFLGEINKFSHGHSDDIGDAYEYLLSKTGSQGDVGQFRTPRHIIKFIVEAVNPTKPDSVLDPACGTAGFLIAAYNHVRSQHDGVDEKGNPNSEKRLTSDEKDKLHSSYHGFDIDPTMVRTASVNMYLHNFTNPDIRNHDTLSSEEFWDNKYDVILANPPFMTPKGGIQPHRKFSVKANRAEVLFVDYIANHLKPTGRAGIIVPEGIIFQSGNAYKQLRKSLIEDSLYAVVSLPSGVFNPYAGVKTSILLLDKKLAKERDDILFVKIENDGFSLGAQRRKVSGNQLPKALEIIEQYKNSEELISELAHVVSRQEIIDSGDYNLSGDRYRSLTEISTEYPLVSLSDLIALESGSRQKGGALTEGIPSIGGEQINESGNIRFGKMKYISKEHYSSMRSGVLQKNDVLVVKDGATTGKTGFWRKNIDAAVNEHVFIFRANDSILPFYLYSVIKSESFQLILQPYIKGIIGGISREILDIKIPLPPLEIQREIVAELDGYQTIIDSAQKIISTYKPTIKINPEWETKPLKDLVSTISPRGKLKSSEVFKTGRIPVIDQSQNFISGYTDREDIKVSENPVVVFGDHTRAVKYIDFKFVQGADGLKILKPKEDLIESKFLYFSVSNVNVPNKGYSRHWSYAKEIEIPLPPLKIQREIVAELESEQKLITANKTLIQIYQQKIKSKLAEVWGE